MTGASILRRWIAVLVAMPLAACSSFPGFVPTRLDPEFTAQRLQARQIDDEGLHAYLQQQGATDWPLATWDLKVLTLAALYFHPDLDLARAQWRVAQAGEAAITNPAELALLGEYHSRRPDGDSPWTFGVTLELPFGGERKREATLEKSRALSAASRIEIAAAAWRVASRVRRAAVEMHVAALGHRYANQELAARQDLLRLVQRRVEVGYSAASELRQPDALRAAALANVERTRGLLDRSLVEMAAALGLPASVVRQMKFSLDSLDQLPAVTELEGAQSERIALTQRIDLQGMLMQYAAAEADLKLALAHTYPELRLGPGYTWDQGDNRWSLLYTLSLPNPATIRRHVTEAQARRELAASMVTTRQHEILAELGAASARYGAALAQLAGSDRALARERERVKQVEHQLERGIANRLELTEVRIDVIQAERVRLEVLQLAQQGLGLVEDALQRPLDQRPLPLVLDRGTQFSAGVRKP